MQTIPPIPGHHLLLLLVQAALLLLTARLLGEFSKRLDQPSVVGELLAGIVLGPSVLGAISPAGFAMLFPRDAAQFHLIELLGWLGMVLLMLLAGFETDVRRLRHLGRAAVSASLLGMLVPFALGFAFAMQVPDRLLTGAGPRGLFAAFFATAMAISAMPIIAKVLRDLDITRRDVGVLILTAGVVDDTAGWLALSVIAGMVSNTFNAWRFVQTIALTGLFLASSAALLYPLARWLFRQVGDHFHSRDNDLALVVIITFLGAAATEAIGVHPVFGAFVAGCVLRQVPRLRHASLQRLESVVMAIFAPLFFGLVGLKVDIASLITGNGAGGLGLLAATFAVEVTGKVVGCTAGGLLGRLSFWEALSVGVGMNARGAMGLVVALVGLNLGILSAPVYAALVLTSIATTFMAPVGLRFTLRRLALSDEERDRMAEGAPAGGLFDPRAVRALVVTAGGPNALAAARLISTVVRGPDASVTALFVDRIGGPGAPLRRLAQRFGRAVGGTSLGEHFASVRAIVEQAGARFGEALHAGDPAEVVRREAGRGADVVLLGMGPRGDALGGRLTPDLLAHPPAHLVLVHAPQAEGAPRGRVLVLSDGSWASRAAMELAVMVAEGAAAELCVLHVLDAPAAEDDDPEDAALDENTRRLMAATLLESAAPIVGKTRAKVTALVEQADATQPPLLRETQTGDYDWVFVGAEGRSLRHRLSTGYEIERLVRAAPCGVAVVVPRLGEE